MGCVLVLFSVLVSEVLWMVRCGVLLGVVSGVLDWCFSIVFKVVVVFCLVVRCLICLCWRLVCLIWVWMVFCCVV